MGPYLAMSAFQGYRVRDAHRVVALTGSPSNIVHIPYEEAYEEGFEDMMRRVPDTTKIRELLGYAPETPLDDILSSVIDYEREQVAPSMAREAEAHVA